VDYLDSDATHARSENVSPNHSTTSLRRLTAIAPGADAADRARIACAPAMPGAPVTRASASDARQLLCGVPWLQRRENTALMRQCAHQMHHDPLPMRTDGGETAEI